LQIHISALDVFGNHRRTLTEGELNGGLAGSEALRRKAETAGTASEADFEGPRGVGFKKHAAIGVGDRDRVIDHQSQRFIERNLGVQEGSGFEEQVELAKAATDRFRAGDVFDAREEMGKGLLAAGVAGSKEELVGIFETKRDGIAVIQKAAFDFFAVDEQPSPLAAVFDVQAARLDDQCRAIARDAAVGELQMISGLGSAPDEERGLRDAHVSASAVRRDDFENCSTEGYRSCVGHGMLETGL
jgi:hypothetical protein